MAVRSGLITITTAGDAQQGTDVRGDSFLLKAHPGNAGTVWVGDDGAGDVTASNGFPLDPGEALPTEVPNLKALWFDSAENGDKICWLRYR